MDTQDKGCNIAGEVHAESVAGYLKFAVENEEPVNNKRAALSMGSALDLPIRFFFPLQDSIILTLI